MNFWGKCRYVGLDLGIIRIEMLFKVIGLDLVIKREIILRENEK